MKCSIIPGLLMGGAMLQAAPLADELDAFSQTAASRIPAEIRAEFSRGIDAVAKSGITEKAIKVGNKAPDFTLKNAAGEEVSLKALLSKGPVVLTWYRGGWCPYCNLTLAAYQKLLPDFEKAGASIVALTPELPDKAAETTRKNGVGFEVLTDLNHQVARRYGLVFDLTPKVAAIYKRRFDLLAYNGKDAGNASLPLAATYVIGADGVVRYAFLNADYRKRAEPSEVLNVVQGVK
jgi:peroxiredoxin